MRSLCMVVCMLCMYALTAQQAAFPGAEGAGMYTTGGRGTPSAPTTVFEVTNLKDDGLPGSLRYALTASATYRTVVFRVSGTIHLNSRLNIKTNTTIAGQTAPGDGICVADYPVSIGGDNVIVRYMRFRLGDKNQKKVDANGNPVDGSGGDDAFGGIGVSNIIIDHCTASWSNDEALTIYRGDNLTIQWCFITEPLNYSYHFETGDTDYERHGFGGIWGAKRASMHHNLIADCNNRNPRFAGVGSYTPNTVGVENCDFRNNVIYNWGINTVYGGEGGNYNVVNNYYKYGPNTNSGVRYRVCNPNFSSTVPYGKWYVAGNYVDGSTTNTADNWLGVVPQGGSADIPTVKATTPFDLGYPFTIQSATDAYEAVLQKAGCSLPNRDTLDQRIVNDVRTRTGRIIDVQGGYAHGTAYNETVNAWPTLISATPPADTDHDGMPDSWESGNGLDPNNATDRNGTGANGYTNLENYLNSLAGSGSAPASQKQLIGIWPAMEGGFENQAAGAVSTATPTGAANLSPTVWTCSSTAGIINNGTARTGSNYFTYTSTSASTKNCFSPAVTSPLFVKGTKYIVQYYYRAPAPATGNGVSGLLAATDNRGTVNFVTAYATIPWAATNGAWAKAALPYSLNNSFTPATVFAGFRFNGGGTPIAQPFDVDDFVVYPADNQSSPSADITAPAAVTSPAAAGKYGSINLGWMAPATGIDGGGYMVIRSSSATQPALNPNGIYSIGNVIGTGNTVVYIGTNTGFTDDGSVASLASGATYYYHIYSVDKAFNYSPAATASAGITANVVVAGNGGGNYSSIQAAINAAPTGRTTPYIIYIKNGRYIEKVNIPSNKPFIQLIGESAGNVIISWDSYAGKTENGVVLGTSNSATMTINANDCFMMNVTVENTTGYTGDGPQALALNVTADRCAFKNCRFIGGQDTVLAHGDGKRQYFLNCYIDGNTDFIFGSSIGVFDSCVIFPRDRIDGSSGGYITATNTSGAQAYGYVFRNCRITENRGVTSYTLGRPWQNSAGFVDKKSNKTVFLNAVMGSSIRPEGWSAWDTGTNTSLITYAEYKSRRFDGNLVDVSQRVSWSKQFSDAEAAPYFVNSNMFGTWDPLTAFPALGNHVADEVAVANFRAQRSATFTTLSWNLCWPMTGVLYEVYRSTDSINFTMIKQISGVSDNVVAYSYTDSLPAQGGIFYYYVKATRPGSVPNTSYIAKVDPSIPLDGDFRSAASGFWTNASSGNGTNSVSIWEKYVASSKSWVLQAKGVQPFNANVTIRSGHTVTMDGLKSVNNLFIEDGAVLKSNGGYGATPTAQALRIGAGSAAGAIIKNDGVLGGDASPGDLILVEINTACASVLWTGGGVSKINRVRPLPANPNALKVIFDQDINLSLNSSAFTAYYNSSTNTTSENVTFTINNGKTIKLVNSAGSFSPAGNTTPNPGGRYTYNIEGTLDLSATTATSNLVPFSTNAASVVSLNIGTAGILKLGTGFNTVNNSPSTTGNNGKVVLTIANGGLVDATKTTTLITGSNYFITSGTGALKRSVGASAVSFPVGVSADRYNPVTLTNSGIPDNFTVSVKNSFDNTVPDASKVVNKQWTIAEEVAGGSNVTVKFGWVLADQAGGFDPAQSLAVMQYKNATWNMTAASLSGNGTLSSPYTATAPGYTTLGAFGIASNTSGARVDVGSTPSALFDETTTGYQIGIYPNPVRDNLKVAVNKIATGATIQLYSANGSLMRSLLLTGKVQNVPVKGLQAGMYYIIVRNGGQTTTRKIVLQ